MRESRFLLTLTAFLVCSILAAGVVYATLPTPPGVVDLFTFLGSLFVLSLIGPITFAWAWGPAPMSPIATLCAIAIPLLSLGILYVGFLKAGAFKWLTAAALLWGGFGGYSAYVAVTGSI